MRLHAAIAVLVAAVIGAIVFVFVEVGGSDNGVKVGNKKAAAACTEQAPTCMPQVEFIDRTGRMWAGDDFAGKVVILNVWATWCKPCRHEMPELVALREKYPEKNVVLLGVLNESAPDAKVAAFISRYKVNYPIVPMNAPMEEALDYPNALPTTYIYDGEGHLIEKKLGAVTLARMSKIIDRAL